MESIIFLIFWNCAVFPQRTTFAQQGTHFNVAVIHTCCVKYCPLSISTERFLLSNDNKQYKYTTPWILGRHSSERQKTPWVPASQLHHFCDLLIHWWFSLICKVDVRMNSLFILNTGVHWGSAELAGISKAPCNSGHPAPAKKLTMIITKKMSTEA